MVNKDNLMVNNNLNKVMVNNNLNKVMDNSLSKLSSNMVMGSSLRCIRMEHRG